MSLCPRDCVHTPYDSVCACALMAVITALSALRPPRRRIYDPVRDPPTEGSPPLRPHLRAGGDDPGVASASQEEEEAGQEPVPRQQQGFPVCE